MRDGWQAKNELGDAGIVGMHGKGFVLYSLYNVYILAI